VEAHDSSAVLGREEAQLRGLVRSQPLAATIPLPRVPPGKQLAGLDALLALATPVPSAAPVPRVRLPVSLPPPERNPRPAAPLRRIVAVGVMTGGILGFILALHIAHDADSTAIRLGWYGTAVVSLIGAKLLLSLLAAPIPASAQYPSSRLRVAGAITCCNEDPGAFSICLESILQSTRLPEVLTVVDDGSDSPDCEQIAHDLAPRFRAVGVDYAVVVFPANCGKRAGLATAFQRAWDADVYLCVDSDTILHPEAIARALTPFGRRRIHAVTGAVFAANRRRNLLTRLIDLRYCYAFLGERAAYSVLGSVLCACGSLALYRGSTVRKYLDDFLGQRFLGRACTYGDDRRLTYYCLREGKSVLAPDALAWTLVPASMPHFLRQQLRWSKSFFRESLWMLVTVRPWRVCWWLTLIELGTWSGFTAALVYSLAVRPAFTGHFAAAAYLLSVLALSYARSGHYLEADHPELGWPGKLGTLALAPLYGLIHMTLLLPLRLVALLTLRDNKWGTRASVETAL
jgi:hyaluronan synthase